MFITGITGKIVLDNNADREPDYWVWSSVPGSGDVGNQPFVKVRMTSPAGSEVTWFCNCTRDTEVVFTKTPKKDLKQLSGIFFQRIQELNQTPFWGTMSNKPPPDHPVCGFHHELCSPDHSSQSAFNSGSIKSELVCCVFLYVQTKCSFACSSKCFDCDTCHTRCGDGSGAVHNTSLLQVKYS